ncbi:MAG: MOFRL family protein [Arhodomonas sp.]|nr:MOFRL family protein [Arhodomonas sp.]
MIGSAPLVAAPPPPMGRCRGAIAVWSRRRSRHRPPVIRRLRGSRPTSSRAMPTPGAVLREAAARGFPIHAHDAEPLAGDAMALERRLAATLIDAAPGVHVSGGEPTVTLPPYPGEGGRMQALALSAARRLAGRRDVALLAAGTDGADGPGEAAGAVVDGGTLARGAHAGVTPPRPWPWPMPAGFSAAAATSSAPGPRGPTSWIW